MKSERRKKGQETKRKEKKRKEKISHRLPRDAGHFIGSHLERCGWLGQDDDDGADVFRGACCKGKEDAGKGALAASAEFSVAERNTWIHVDFA